jgi:hypothetical protein
MARRPWRARRKADDLAVVARDLAADIVVVDRPGSFWQNVTLNRR